MTDTHGVALVEFATGVELGAAWACAGACAAPGRARAWLEDIPERPGLVLYDGDGTGGVQEEVVRDLWEHGRVRLGGSTAKGA